MREARHEIVRIPFAIYACRALPASLGFVHRPACEWRSGSQAPCIKEDDVKELTLEEVLRIAGGLPLPVALDELTYRAPQEAVADPVDYAHLLPAGLRPSEPT